MRLSSANLLDLPEPAEMGEVHRVYFNCQVTGAKRSTTARDADAYSGWVRDAVDASFGDAVANEWQWPHLPYLATDPLPAVTARSGPGANQLPAVRGPESGLPPPQHLLDTAPAPAAAAVPMLDQPDEGVPPPPPPIARPGSAARMAATPAPAVATPPTAVDDAAVVLELRRQNGQGFGMEISTQAQVTAFRGERGSGAAERAGVALGWYITHVDGRKNPSDPTTAAWFPGRCLRDCLRGCRARCIRRRYYRNTEADGSSGPAECELHLRARARAAARVRPKDTPGN